MIGDRLLLCGDCLTEMQKIETASVDLILCDLPYGVTQNSWDVLIDLPSLWREYRRIRKPTTPVVLTAIQPFTSLLITSNLAEFKYTWTWRKPKGTGHLNARKQPLRDCEDVTVFYEKQCLYQPQMRKGSPYTHSGSTNQRKGSNNYGKQGVWNHVNSGIRHPTQTLNFNSVPHKIRIHATQKPEELMTYFIRTYTKANDIVLDNCMGSGTAGVAALNIGRRFIGIERDPIIFAQAAARIEEDVF